MKPTTVKFGFIHKCLRQGINNLLIYLLMSSSNSLYCFLTSASVDELIGWAGIGTVRLTAFEVTAGKILVIASAAAVALSRPLLEQSSNVNRDCRTGFEYETCEEKGTQYTKSRILVNTLT